MTYISDSENSLRGRVVFIAMLAVFLMAPVAALSQALPWKSPSQNTPVQTMPPQAMPSSQPFHAPSVKPGHAMESTSRRDDDRELNLLAMRFYSIHAKTDPKAISKLKALEYKVSSYRKNLETRSYDVTDISNDAKKLESRIAIQRKKLEEEANATSAPSAPIASQPPPPPPSAPVMAPPPPPSMAPPPTSASR